MLARYKNIELLDCMVLSNKSDDFCEGVRFALEQIDALPTADVEEVCRCKECYYGEPSNAGGIICHFGGKWIGEHYCSSGTPKEREVSNNG